MFELPAELHVKVKWLHRYRWRLIAAAFLSPPIGLLCAAILTWLVRNGEFVSIPQDAAKYMLETMIWHFSPGTLAALVRSEHRSTVWLPVLLAIYYIYYVALVAVPLTGPLSLLLYVRHRPVRHEQGLLASTMLIDAMGKYIDQPSFRRRAALSRAARAFAPSSSASPVKAKWVEEPAYQWFKSATLARPERDIVLSLGSFKDSILKSIARRVPLDSYPEVLAKLQEFFFLICTRSSRHFGLTQRRRSALRRPMGPEREVELLREFALLARPLILAAARATTPQEKPSRVKQLLFELRQSRAIQAAGALSSVAAGVMTLGILAFGIDLAQAFLTWFTVTFGSFAISLGITSVRITRSTRKPVTDDEDSISSRS